MKTSKRGLGLIARFEGTVLHAYNDPSKGKHCTVGIGHKLHDGPCTDHDYRTYGTKNNPKLTQAQALKLLALDITSREAAVERLVRVKLNPNEFDALVSFVFNLGAGALEESTLLKCLNRGRRKDAADQFPRWNKADGVVLEGLTRRRNAERALFLAPIKEKPVPRPQGAPRTLPKKYFDHWRRPWLRKARNSIGFRHWLGRNGYLSPHFSKSSAASKDGRPIPKRMIPRARNHAFRLEVLRHKLNDKPISPLSWYRSPEHNVAVGGASKSKHMQAIATDHPNSWVDANGGQERLKSIGEQVGFNGVGIYPAGSMHLDSRRGSFTWWRSF